MIQVTNTARHATVHIGGAALEYTQGLLIHRALTLESPSLSPIISRRPVQDRSQAPGQVESKQEVSKFYPIVDVRSH